MSDTFRDPFGERRRVEFERCYHVLGCALRIRGDDRRLAALADAAFGAASGRRGARPTFSLTLRLAPDATRFGRRAPPAARMSAGAGWLCGVVDAANYALVCPAGRSALVSISTSMLRHAYHARYELLEFAALTLLGRGMPLVPLHAACVGVRGAGVLLIGDSGAGKSTLCAAALASGWDFVSEDATFVTPASLWAAGIPTFLHLRGGSLRFLDDADFAARVRASPTIRRRSGVRKYEVDLRRTGAVLARNGLPLRAIVVLSGAAVRAGRLSRPLPVSAVRAALTRTQPYAAGLESWSEFLRQVRGLPAFELRRATPAVALREIRRLLGSRR